MDFIDQCGEEDVTVSKICVSNPEFSGCSYLLIEWHADFLIIYLYNKRKTWRGKLTCTKIIEFSKALDLDFPTYLARTRWALSQQAKGYQYELKDGFFYWEVQARQNNCFEVEGYVPVEKESSKTAPDLIEVLLAMNDCLRHKMICLSSRIKFLNEESQNFMKDVSEFFKLKLEMENSISAKFLTIMNIKNSKEPPC